MTDYHPLIARAVEGLDKSTGEARRALYERARTALVTQLRSVEPALSESEITKERLALEEAIRKVEAEAARKARTEPRGDARAAAPAARRERTNSLADKLVRSAREGRQAEPTPPKPDAQDEPEAEAPRPPAQTARERLLGGRTPTLTEGGIKGFRNVVNEVHDLGGAGAKAAQSARDTRDSYGAGSAQQFPPADEAADAPPRGRQSRFEAEWDSEQLRFAAAQPRAVLRAGRRAAADAAVDAAAAAARRCRGGVRERAPGAFLPRPGQAPRRLARFRGGGGDVGMGLAEIHRALSLRQPDRNAAAEPDEERDAGVAVAAQDLRPGAAGAEPEPALRRAARRARSRAPAVAQRVVLYEEDPNDPQGRRYVGSAIWRTETVSPGAGLAPELAVRADVEIPERRMTVTWSLRRNTDQALPASHTIEIMFNLPADFPGGGIANVPGILMKQSEQARGTPLAGLAVKVTNNFFLVGLSAVATDMQRNMQLLKERTWFDIPVVYTNGGRAILAMEKGPPGDRAFNDAFAAWEKK